jgi:glycosyltransferase involved in cell wall biosynthesis
MKLFDSVRSFLGSPNDVERRVLIISQFFPPEGIGGGYRWKQFATHLPEDTDCHVICPPPTLPYGEFERTFRPIQHEQIDGISVTRLWTYQPTSDSTSDGSNLSRVINYGVFAFLATLYTVLNAWRFDCIVTMSSPHTTFIPGFVGKLLGCPWIVDIYDLWLDNAVDFGYTSRDSLVYRFFSVLERQSMVRSDGVVTITLTLANQLQRKYPQADPDKFTPVPFGVDEELFYPTPSNEREREVVYVGNLGEVHAFDSFMRAFERLPDDTILTFVGSGKRQEYLKNLSEELGIEDRVQFVGTVPRAEVPEIVGRSTASIVPLETGQHLDYACPTKLIETMAVGTPFVGSAVTEIANVAERSDAGFAVENDVGDIYTAFYSLFSDPERREKMGNNGVEYVNDHHRWDVLTEHIEQVLENAVDSRP